MKKKKRLSKLLLLCFTLICFVSCNDDDSFQDEFTDDQESVDSEDDEETGEDNTDGDTDGGDNTDSSAGGEGEITLYNIVGTNLVKVNDFEVTGIALEFQNDVAKHQEIWELTKKVIPASQMTRISEFLIFSGEESGTAGFVIPKADDLSKWQFAIAIDLAYEGGLNTDGELVHTIVHEFGHVLTLNNTQLDSSITATDCMNFFPGEGCAKSEAYINLLQTQFWADIEDEFNMLESEESVAAFYEKYNDRFVTDYAATNPGEDIAEVFAAFVIRAGGVNGTSIVEQKIQLMYDASELTELRDFIRSNDIVAKGVGFLPTGKLKRKYACGTSFKRTNFKL